MLEALIIPAIISVPKSIYNKEYIKIDLLPGCIVNNTHTQKETAEACFMVTTAQNNGADRGFEVVSRSPCSPWRCASVGYKHTAVILLFESQ